MTYTIQQIVAIPPDDDCQTTTLIVLYEDGTAYYLKRDSEGNFTWWNDLNLLKYAPDHEE